MVDGDEAKKELTWCDRDPPPPELARISVFDAQSARMYVDDERQIEFLPYELDIATKLGAVVRHLGENVFAPREKALTLELKSPLPGGYNSLTTVSRTLNKLVPATALGDLPVEASLRELAQWTPEFQQQLEQQQEELRNDPATLAKERRRVKMLLANVSAEIALAESIVSDECVNTLRERRDDAALKRSLAEASASDLFKDEPIPGLGSTSWRKLLAYAGEFAAEMYPDRDPPQLASGDYCVLCQQELTMTSRERLTRFDEYLRSRANEDAEKAREAFHECAQAIRSLSVRSTIDEHTFLADCAELSDARRQLVGRIRDYLLAVAARHELVCRVIKDLKYDTAPTKW
jgi:hypothetical protein